MPVTHTKVSTIADGSTTEHVRPSDWNADHTLSRPVTFPVGSSSTAPIVIQSGTLLTVASSGAVEADVNCLYYTAQSSARQVVRAEQIIFNTSAYTGTTAGTAQKMFDASTGLAGALTVGPSISYMFETAFTITGRSTLTHVISYGFAGTAAIDRQTWTCIQGGAAASSVPSAASIVRCTVNNSPINVTNTSSNCTAFIQGRLTIGTSGTIIPQITRSASVVALVIAPDSYFRAWPIGSTAINRVGHWS
jgi:hypothetical protein